MVRAESSGESRGACALRGLDVELSDPTHLLNFRHIATSAHKAQDPQDLRSKRRLPVTVVWPSQAYFGSFA